MGNFIRTPKYFFLCVSFEFEQRRFICKYQKLKLGTFLRVITYLQGDHRNVATIYLNFIYISAYRTR